MSDPLRIFVLGFGVGVITFPLLMLAVHYSIGVGSHLPPQGTLPRPPHRTK